MDDNPGFRDRLNVNTSTSHNKPIRERFICFIRGAKWMKINRLNGPSPIHDTSTWLKRKSPLKVLQNRLSAITISSQQVLISKPDACTNVTTLLLSGGWAYGHVVTKISWIGRLPNFVTHDAQLRALRARGAPL